jgi:hypothetical protein
MKLNKKCIETAAKTRFAPDKIEVRNILGWWGVFVGNQREQCYGVFLMEDGSIDFERCD